MTQPGKFISFEGGEGCGKTTQLKRLGQWLRDKGTEVVTTRELGGTPGAEMLRPVVQSGDVDRWDATSEALIIYAGRRDHTNRLIKPSLAAGKWVLSDRYFDTSHIYQGINRDNLAAVLQIQQIAIGDFKPDLTLVFDMDPVKGLERAMADAATRPVDNTRFERMGLDFHLKSREGFLQIVRDNPDRCMLIDATGTLEQVEQRVQAAITQKFGL